MGLPETRIAFLKAATSGIQQGKGGILCVPLVNQAFTTGTSTIKHRITMSADIDALPTYNYKTNTDIKSVLKKAWLGGVKEILVLVFDKVKTKSAIMLELQNYEFNSCWLDLLILDTPASKADIISGGIDLNDKLNKMVFFVGQDVSANHESFLNIEPLLVKASNDSGPLTQDELLARFAGEFEGIPLTSSSTYRVLTDLVDCTLFQKTQLDASIDAGRITLKNDGDKIKIARGVTSLVTLGDKPSDFKKIKPTRIAYKVKKDINSTLENEYIGKVNNTYMDKLNLLAIISEYFKTLERNGLLDPGKNYIEINISKQKDFLASLGEKVSDMKDQEIKEANTRDKVFFKGKFKPIDSMEDFDIEFSM